MDIQIEPSISNNTNNNENNSTNNNGTVFSSILSLSNTIIGTGILSLPFTLSNSGVTLGILFFIFSAYITKLSLCLYIDAAKILAPNKYDIKISTLSDIMNMPKLGMFINFSIILNGFGTATSLLIAASDFILSLTENLLPSGYTGLFLDKRFWITVEILIVIPIVFRKSLAALKSFSLFSILSISYLTFSIIISYFILSKEEPSAVEPSKVTPDTEIEKSFMQEIFKKFMSLSIIIFAYGCQQNAFPIYSELKPSHRPYISYVFSYAVFFCSVIYIIIGYCGYATFGDNVQSNILNNYESSNIIINIARFAMAIYCTFTYSVQMHPCRESIKKEYISYKIRHQKDYGDINENNNNNDDEKEHLIKNNNENNNYGSTSGLLDLQPGSCHSNGNSNSNSNSNTQSKANSSNNSTNNIINYDDDEDDDEFESQIDANDADDERSSDSHHIKYINIDILDNLVCPVNNNITSINNYDSETLFNCVTIILVVSSYIFAMICNDFGMVLSIIGSTSCTTLTFILPNYLYLKITRGATFKRLQCMIFLILGSIIGVFGTIAPFY